MLVDHKYLYCYVEFPVCLGLVYEFWVKSWFNEDNSNTLIDLARLVYSIAVVCLNQDYPDTPHHAYLHLQAHS